LNYEDKLEKVRLLLKSIHCLSASGGSYKRLKENLVFILMQE